MEFTSLKMKKIKSMRMMIVIAEIELFSLSLSLSYRYLTIVSLVERQSGKHFPVYMCVHASLRHLVSDIPFPASFFFVYLYLGNVRMQLQMYIESIYNGDDEKKMSGEMTCVCVRNLSRFSSHCSINE